MGGKKICVMFLFFLFSCLLCISHLRAQVNNDNLVIIMDDSSSMGDSLYYQNGVRTTRMFAAKEALKEVLKNVPPTTQIGLISFRKGWVYNLAPKNLVTLYAAIDKLSADYPNTPLREFIKRGADCLLRQREKQYGYGTYRLLVVTDGEANKGGPVDDYTQEVISRGIIFDVIGVGMKKEHTLATKVHSYRSALDTASLKRAIAEVVAAESITANDQEISNEVYEMISYLPDGFADAAIKALYQFENYPIGEKPGAQKGTSTKTRKQQPSGQKSTQSQDQQKKKICFISGL